LLIYGRPQLPFAKFSVNNGHMLAQQQMKIKRFNFHVTGHKPSPLGGKVFSNPFLCFGI